MDLKFVQTVHIIKEIFTILFAFVLFTILTAGSANSQTSTLKSGSARNTKYKVKMK